MELPALIVAALALIIVSVVSVLASRRASEVPAQTDDSTPGTGSDDQVEADLATLAEEMEPVMEKLSHPGEALNNAAFAKAVSALAGKDYTLEQTSNYALGANWVLSCAAYEALRRREDSASVVDKAVKAVSNSYAWPLFFLLRFAGEKMTRPIAADVLCGVQYWWPDNPAFIDQMSTFLQTSLDAGDPIRFGERYADLDAESRKSLDTFVRALPEQLCTTLRAKLDKAESEAIDWAFLKSVGVVLDRQAVSDTVFETEAIARLKKDLKDEIASMPGKSMLIVGESGVGKSALVRALVSDLIDDHWTVLRTSAAALIADKIYIGQIEGQIRRLAENAAVSKRVAVYVENISEFRQLGRYKGNNNSVLDQLWPHIEGRKVMIIGETTPSELQTLIREHPALKTVVKVATMNPLGEAETSRMAGELLAQIDPHVDEGDSGEVVSESLRLAQQYLSHKSLPGSVLSLLQLAVLRARRDDAARGVQRIDVLGALSQISGLPEDVLDESQTLDVGELATLFRARIVGQDEAVDCLVERIAMLKAGLTDPGRPIGVFLFAGPTGTGKTEIAKTLAEILFGSPEQMIRFDMSEFQDADSVYRLIGRNDLERDGSLVARIREKPFSVVLLDEFEKSHAKVWDIFLQVFDDGRLTDSNGQLADFRHAIIILTSNLGATIASEAGIGFRSTSGEFSAGDVLRTVNRTFRREFVNRLDRVVVFKPLNRDVMRTILGKELEKALRRRGLRSKQWAVEWEDSAIEFLLDEGFTPDLGARPLRRAIERHLLAPLSITIVQNKAPAGEQFLFVRSDGESLQVEFIDPDAEIDAAAAGAEPAMDAGVELNLALLVGSGSVPPGAAGYLKQQLSRISDRVGSQAWTALKSQGLDEINSAEFWERPDRYERLDRIELIDRIESATSVMNRLSQRLSPNRSNAQLITSLANRLYVLNEGLLDLDEKRPTQAYLGVRLVTADRGLDNAEQFLNRLVDMYRNWAKARGMRLEELDGSASRYAALFIVSGFGSYGILEPESGLHVFESPRDAAGFERIRARVEVAGVRLETGGGNHKRAKTASAELDRAAQPVEIVRRYRERPSPLTRDSRRGFRTGRLAAVFQGDFDVLPALEHARNQAPQISD